MYLQEWTLNGDYYILNNKHSFCELKLGKIDVEQYHLVRILTYQVGFEH